MWFVVILFFISIFIDCIVLTVNQFARTIPLGEWRLLTIFNGVHIEIQKHLILGRVQTTEQWFLTSTLILLTWSRSRCVYCTSLCFLFSLFSFLCWLYFCRRHCRRHIQLAISHKWNFHSEFWFCLSFLQHLFSIQLFVVWDATNMSSSKYRLIHFMWLHEAMYVVIFVCKRKI